MNVQKVVEEFKEKYPGKNIVVTDEGEYEEVICEVDPAKEHPEWSLAVVVLGKKYKKHLHKRTTEIYKVLKGKLNLYIDGKKHVLNKNGKIEIKHGETHWGEGNETWFSTYSTPGWTPEDHILVD